MKNNYLNQAIYFINTYILTFMAFHIKAKKVSSTDEANLPNILVAKPKHGAK